MKRVFGLLGVTTACVFALSSTAMAAYTPQNDQAISVRVLPGTVSPSGSTGQTSFKLQEAAHQTVTTSSGASVDHYYYWVYVNGQPVLAVDPFCMYE